MHTKTTFIAALATLCIATARAQDLWGDTRWQPHAFEHDGHHVH